jgi:hypothetical protein
MAYMDRWHVVLTLTLEMLGFGLAYIHVFHESIARRASTRARRIQDLWLSRLDLSSSGVDYADPPIPYERRGPTAANRVVNKLLQVILIIVLFSTLNFGSGLGWGVAEFAVALLLSVPASIVLHLLMQVIASVVIELAIEAGRGNIVAGVGFFLATVGMLIETADVIRSDLWWTLAVLWGITGLVVLSVSNKSRPSRQSDDEAG